MLQPDGAPYRTIELGKGAAPFGVVMNPAGDTLYVSLQGTGEVVAFDVTSASNGRQAHDLLQRRSFDLVLSDQQMPMMTGIQLCEAMRALPAHRHTPFILLTAKCMEIDFAKLRVTPGISKALPKPFSPSELVACIEETLATRMAVC